MGELETGDERVLPQGGEDMDGTLQLTADDGGREGAHVEGGQSVRAGKKEHSATFDDALRGVTPARALALGSPI